MPEFLTTLLFLACPVGMGAMMWFMARGNRQPRHEPKTMSLSELRAEHERLSAEMDRATVREEVRS